MQTTPYLKSAGKSAPKPLLFTLAQPYLKKQSFINLLFMILLLWEMISYRFFNVYSQCKKILVGLPSD